MVPDNTVHLIQTPPSLGTRGILIFDIAIASYSTAIFSIIFIYFILQVKPHRETIQEAPTPHQTVNNVRNSNPLGSTSSNTRKGGYGKLSDVGPTEANTGLFHPSFFVLWFPTSMPLTFYRPIPHGAAAAAPPAPAPTRACHRYVENPGWLGLWAGAGDPGGGARRLQMMILTKTKISTTEYCRNQLG